MNAFTKIFARRGISLPVVSFFFFALLVGCASSKKAERWVEIPPPDPSVVDVMQKTIDSLRSETGRLRTQIERLERENRNLIARAAELETRPTLPPRPEPGVVGNHLRMEYDRGLSLFRQRNYEDAAAVFMGLLNAGAPEGLEDNCHYWIGESYYGLKQYAEAIRHFEKVLTYERSTKIDDAQIMIANSYLRMSNRERARQEYQKLIERYPASPYVRIAKQRLGQS